MASLRVFCRPPRSLSHTSNCVSSEGSVAPGPFSRAVMKLSGTPTTTHTPPARPLPSDALRRRWREPEVRALRRHVDVRLVGTRRGKQSGRKEARPDDQGSVFSHHGRSALSVDDSRQCTVRVTHCTTEQGGKGSASDIAERSTLKDREIRLALRHRAAACRSRQVSSAHPTRPRRATARGQRSLLQARTEMRGSSCSPEKGRSIVEPAAVSPFAAWENFYVIVGSSAAALTGLQFVVVVLEI